MSLEVYLYSSTACQHCGQESGVASRELFTANITHNLTRMAAEAGLYEALWRPEEYVAPELAAVLRDAEQAKGYWHADTESIRAQLPTDIRASQIAGQMRVGSELLRSNPGRFKAYNPENGWGSYDGLVKFVSAYLEACEANPTARVEVSR